MPHTKVIVSGDTIEVFKYSGDCARGRRGKRKDSSRGYKRYRKAFTFREDNARRRKINFERLVRANCSEHEPPAFITVTMASLCPLPVAYGLFSRFTTKLRRVYGHQFRYIAVPEFQKRGAVHFHCLAWGLTKEVLENERNSRTLQRYWLRGFIDVMATDGSSRLARYLSKYMSKTLSDSRLCGQKSYCASRNVLRPLSVSLGAFSLAGVCEEITGYPLDDLDLISQKDYDTQWLGRGQYKIYRTKKKQQ